VTDQTIEGFASVLPDTTGALHLIVPLHPESHVSGGAVQLMFTDSVVACAPVDFTIQPMPAADGEFAAVVDLFQDILTDQAAIMGTTPEELIATPLQDLPPALWPLAIAQTTVDDPANDSSLRAFVDGLLDAEALDVANRLLALTDVLSSLEEAQPAPPPTEFSVTTAIQQIPFEDCTVDAVGSSASQLDSAWTPELMRTIRRAGSRTRSPLTSSQRSP
jgi:hypothetical protein